MKTQKTNPEFSLKLISLISQISDGVGDGQLKVVKDYELLQVRTKQTRYRKKNICRNRITSVKVYYIDIIFLFKLKQACSLISEDYKPPFTFVVVQKRINARFYLKKGAQAENPAPGSVLDHTITRRGLYDFYLVPQSVRQGTVTPTHCVVLEVRLTF